MHFTIARRAAILAATPILLVTLAACGSGNGPTTVESGIAVPAGIGATSTAPASEASDKATATPTAVPVAADWQETTQFVEIKGSGETNGVEYLELRKAGQDGAKTVTFDDQPWIKVAISAEATNVPKTGIGGDTGQLTASLEERTDSEKNKGFNVEFDKEGQVSKVTWLYVTSRERTNTAIEKWSDSTQFLQIQSAREQDGVTYLKVRPAEKEYLGESFDTITIGRPWTEVQMSALAVNAPLRGVQGDADALRAQLGERAAIEVDEGFDITFTGNGQVSKVAWLFA